MSIETKIMEIVGKDFAGNDAPPYPRPLYYRCDGNGLLRVETCDRDTQVISSNNDGFEVWFGWGDHWKHHMGEAEVRALFWWLLWEWYAKARWFGLRRPIYYWALRRHVRRFQRRTHRPADPVRCPKCGGPHPFHDPACVVHPDLIQDHNEQEQGR